MRNEFLFETGKQYQNMKGRFSAKYDAEDGSLRRVGRTIPFTKDEYRAWVGGMYHSERGLRCAYCERKLKLEQMEPDHKLPVKRGGALGLSNIAPACRDCNIAKGELDAPEWIAFLKGLATFPEAARRYILKKLRQRPVFRPHTSIGGKAPRKLVARSPKPVKERAPMESMFQEDF